MLPNRWELFVTGLLYALAASQELAKGKDAAFMTAKMVTAQFYAQHILVRTSSLRDSIVAGGDVVSEMALDSF